MGSLQLWISPLAASDLKNILSYGNQNWGRDRAKKYKNDLKDALWRFIAFPSLGVERNELIEALRCLAVNEHLVFYRIKENKIEILRVLHGRQDPQSYL